MYMAIDKITRATLGVRQYEKAKAKALLEDKVVLLFLEEGLKPMFIAERLGVTRRYVQSVLSRKVRGGRKD
jgi:DNA-binding transcriptional regulator LsrR (DeoR family)